MKLTELEPKFLKIIDLEKQIWNWEIAKTPQDADGIFFLCPVCFAKNGGPVGTHGIICWKPSVPQTVNPIPGRWDMVGTGFEDLTLVAGSSSIFLTTSPCQAHFHITNGAIC